MTLDKKYLFDYKVCNIIMLLSYIFWFIFAVEIGIKKGISYDRGVDLLNLMFLQMMLYFFYFYKVSTKQVLSSRYSNKKTYKKRKA